MSRLLFATALLLTACVATPKEPVEPARGHMAQTNQEIARRTSHPQSDMTCQDEVPTGTNLERRKCRSDAEREQDRELARQMILNPTSRPNCDPAQMPNGACPTDPGVAHARPLGY